MEQQTENSQFKPEAPKVFRSEREEELEIKRLMLNKMNRLKGGESPEQVEEAYREWEADRDATSVVRAKRAEDERRLSMSEAVTAQLQTDLRRFRINPDGMDDAAMREELDKTKKQAAIAEQQLRRDAATELVKNRADAIFRKSECPARHVLNLDRIDEGQNQKWIDTRNLLVGQAGYANGFLIAMLGNRGVGKTQLVVSVIDRCSKKMLTCRYIKALDLFRDFRRAYTPVQRGQAGESEEDIIDGWTRWDLLVVDELHQRGETPFENNTLVNLLDRRYDARRCTILIANQSKAEFAAAIGDSVVSRIYETGEAIVCDWESYRRRDGWRQQPGSEHRKPSGIPPEPRTVIYG